MRDLALGLIETRGLVAALEAADAALKAAEVKLISKDRVDAALVTVKLVGEVAAVEAAVAAGAEAAARVGKLVGKHVIARPDAGIFDELIAVEIDSRKKKKPSPSLRAPSPEPPPELPLEFTLQMLSGYTVEEMRRLARRLSDFPLQGREISRANRDELARLLQRFATDAPPPSAPASFFSPSDTET